MVYICGMSTEEVFAAITSVPKWYVGYMSVQAASNLKRRFKEGRVRHGILEHLFNHFGYTKQLNWVKKDEK